MKKKGEDKKTGARSRRKASNNNPPATGPGHGIRAILIAIMGLKERTSPPNYNSCIRVLEILYSIFLVYGFKTVIEDANKEGGFYEILELRLYSPKEALSVTLTAVLGYLSNVVFNLWPLIVCTLFLVRFAFAPVCNIKPLVDSLGNTKPKSTPRIFSKQGLKELSIWVDVLFLMLHGFIFFNICGSAFGDFAVFLRLVITLLIFNSIWLFIVDIRSKAIHYTVWIWNNGIHALFIFIFYQLGLIPVCVILMITNSIVDFLLTTRAYLAESTSSTGT